MDERVSQIAIADLLPWEVLRVGGQRVVNLEGEARGCFEAGSHSGALRALNSCPSLQIAEITVMNHHGQLPVGLTREPSACMEVWESARSPCPLHPS